MDRKKIVLQALLISGIVSLGAVVSAQALSLGSDATTTTTNVNTSSFGTSLNTNTSINTSTTTTTTSTSTATDANIQFNEFFGDSASGWVELYNSGSTPVDVTNWVILSNAGDSEILTGVVTPNGYAVFDGITTNSLATLQSDSGQVIDTQRYTAVTSTQSWSQYTSNVFACDASPTPLTANAQESCIAANSNANTNTTANANRNTNANKNTNTTNTNSNTNTNTNTATTETTGGVNATSSLYTIDRAWESLRLALTVDDEKEAELSLAYAAERLAEAEDIVTEEQQTQAGDTNTNNTNNTNTVNTQETTTDDSTTTVKLSEIVHTDYIELYNPSTKAIDVTSYTLEVKDVAGVKTYVLPTAVVAPEKYLVISAETSGLKVDKTGGRVRLLDTTATPVATTLIPYDVYANSWSFNLTSKQWACTSTTTKEAENSFTDCVAETDEQVPVNENTNTGTTENVNEAIENTNSEETAQELPKTTNEEVENTNVDTGNTNQVIENTNEEVVTETKEELKDTDQDGLTDEVETENATNPDVADTDGDGVDDANDPEPTGEEEVKEEPKDENVNTETTNEVVENTNEEAINENENTNEAAENVNTETANDNTNTEEENTNAEVENTNEAVGNSNENTNEEATNENENTNEAVDEETPEDEGTELSEEASAAVEETMKDFEELVDHAGEQEVSEEAATTNAETLTELVEEIETIQEEVTGETEQALEEAKTKAEEEVAVLEAGDEDGTTNENTNGEAENGNENTNEEVTNENENTNEEVDENGNENVNAEDENTNGEAENTNENSNGNVNEDTNTNTENTNEAVENTNAVSNDDTNSESDETLPTEDIDAQRLQEELDLAIDEINKLREENEALQAQIKELEDKLYKSTGEEVSEENTAVESDTGSSLTGNDKYSIITRASQLPDFTNVVGHVYFRELRAQPGDFTSTPGEYAFHNLDKVMYKLTLPDGSTSSAIYPGEVFIMDLEGGEYTYSSVNHPDFGPYKITIE